MTNLLSLKDVERLKGTLSDDLLNRMMATVKIAEEGARLHESLRTVIDKKIIFRDATSNGNGHGTDGKSNGNGHHSKHTRRPQTRQYSSPEKIEKRKKEIVKVVRLQPDGMKLGEIAEAIGETKNVGAVGYAIAQLKGEKVLRKLGKGPTTRYKTGEAQKSS